MAMFNDEIVIVYVLFAIYFLLKNQPIVSSIFVTLGLSVKAGVGLLLPAYLGLLQYNYGTIKLLICFSIIVGF